MEFIEDPSNETIVKNFPVLQHLKPSFYMSSKGYNLLSLDNKNLIDNATANDYISQLKQLGDVTFRIIPEDLAKDKMISDLFKNFSLIATYQQGTGKSGLSFIKSLDPEPFVQLIKVPAIQFQKSALKDLSNLSEENRAKEQTKRFSIFNSLAGEILNKDSYKNYLKEPSEFLGSLEVKDLDKKESLSDVDNTSLYIKYREALANKAFDDAMSETLLGTAILNDVESEIIRRGLPLITEVTTQSSTSKIGFNISNISPNSKDPKKAKIATDIIEFGRDTATRKSSTKKYGEAAVSQDIQRNSGNYNSNTVAFTSTSGNNVATKEDIDNTVNEILKVLNAGGSIIMDNKTNRNSNWNKSGEGKVWEQFTKQIDISKLKNISKDPDFVQVRLSTTQPTSEVEILRADEIAEFKRDINNPELFITDGKIDKNKIMSSNNVKAKEIYNRYSAFITPLLEAQKIEQNNTVKSLVNQGQLSLFTTIDSALETFYNGLSTEESNNTNLPSIEYAQDFYTNAPHAYKNINEYIESLKCL